jgi:hypothetical protein
MKRLQSVSILAVAAALAIAVVAMVSAQSPTGADAAAIRAVIEKSYFHGAFNELNPDAMRAGFHPDFAIFSADGDAMAKYPIAAWAESVAKRKGSPGFDPKTNAWDCRIVTLDVTGSAAAAKVELSRNGKLVYTDYLSLLKFSSGWRIAAKVYQEHK